ncbi:hypothetical protein J2W54_004942 [Rhodococcus fascians]|nr:hypothetical protein [Rhodococcus sp. 3258]MDR6934526.1 hypothetical protein [Rhodococcus fascians]
MPENNAEGRRLAALQRNLDTNDFSHLLADATLDTDIDDNPMVGITVRLPRNTLQKARQIADHNGTRVTTLIRHWVEQAVGQNTSSPPDTPRVDSTPPAAGSAATITSSWTIEAVGAFRSHLPARGDEFDSIVEAMTKGARLSRFKESLR